MEFLRGLEDADPGELFTIYETSQAFVWACSICNTSLPGPAGGSDFPKKLPGCGHIVHEGCITQQIEGSDGFRNHCPECLTEFPCDPIPLDDKQMFELEIEREATALGRFDDMAQPRSCVWLASRVYDDVMGWKDSLVERDFNEVVDIVIRGPDGFYATLGQVHLLCQSHYMYGERYLRAKILDLAHRLLKKLKVPYTDRIERLLVLVYNTLENHEGRRMNEWQAFYDFVAELPRDRVALMIASWPYDPFQGKLDWLIRYETVKMFP